jgi:hypothetical protein
MNFVFPDLYNHQAWADALHWKVFESFPKALSNEGIKKRLYHIHLVQNAFLAIVCGENFERKKYEDFSD